MVIMREAFLPLQYSKMTGTLNLEGKNSRNHSVVTRIFVTRVGALTPQSGERDPVAPKPYVMLAVFDGRRRCANSRRQPKQATRVRFPLTTLFPPKLIFVLKALPLITERFCAWELLLEDHTHIYNSENTDIEQHAQR